MRRTLITSSFYLSVATLAFLSLLAPQPCAARELQGRLGLGYNSQFANTTPSERVPGISLKYAFSRDLALEAVFGIATTSPSNTVTGAKLFKNIFLETNLNFYAMLGAPLLSAQDKSGL